MMTANLLVADHDVVARPAADDMTTLSSPLSRVLTDELTGAADALGVTIDVILVAALGRTIQRTIDVGTVSLDMTSYGASLQSLPLRCVPPAHTSATNMLAVVHHAIAALTLARIVHGVPDDGVAQPLSDVLFTLDDAVAGRGHLGHVLELHAAHASGVLHLDWRYDVRSFDPYTVQELAEQFPLALIELTSEAASPLAATAELAMAH